ncbi:MAG TPA: hypothetical protein VH164_00045, partial [Ktedonobacteraceae bacterium]|nr:hypothetical protein [Ktedonobacteraceae bacterium]
MIEAPIRELEPQAQEKPDKDMLKGRGMYRVALAYGRFIQRFRWPVLALWIVVIAISAMFMLRTLNLLSGGDTTIAGSESVQVSTLLKQQFHQNSSQALIVFQSPTTPVSNSAYQQEITALTGKLRTLPAVQGVTLNPVGA